MNTYIRMKRVVPLLNCNSDLPALVRAFASGKRILTILFLAIRFYSTF